MPIAHLFLLAVSILGVGFDCLFDEEGGTEGRAFAHIATGTNAGTSYELPYLGKFAWENAVASPTSSNKTVVAGLDDGTGGQVYFYIGTKTGEIWMAKSDGSVSIATDQFNNDIVKYCKAFFIEMLTIHK